VADTDTLEEKIRVTEAVLDRLVEWVHHFETKSSMLLGLVTGMLAALAAFAPARAAWTPLVIAAGLAAFIAIAACLTCLYFGNYPRTRGPASLLFFGSIAQMTAGDYRRRMSELDPREYLDDLLNQSHTLSVILDARYPMLAHAYRWLFAALPFWAITIYAGFASATPR
jgi:hypothetical protein